MQAKCVTFALRCKWYVGQRSAELSDRPDRPTLTPTPSASPQPSVASLSFQCSQRSRCSRLPKLNPPPVVIFSHHLSSHFDESRSISDVAGFWAPHHSSAPSGFGAHQIGATRNIPPCGVKSTRIILRPTALRSRQKEDGAGMTANDVAIPFLNLQSADRRSDRTIHTRHKVYRHIRLRVH